MSTTGTMYLIFNGRFPSEKAAALFAAKNAEAFLASGIRPTLLLPRVRKSRMALVGESESFLLPKGVPAVYLPVIDLFRLPFLGYFSFPILYVTFSFSLLWYLFFRAEKEAIWYSNESLPIFALSIFGAKTFYEMHDFPEKSIRFYRSFLKRVKGAVITNTWKAKKAESLLGLSFSRILVEQNAVDLNDFDISENKKEAREKLGLENEGQIVLYTGHLYGWKGVDTLALAAKKLPHVKFVFVGGRIWDDVPEFLSRYEGVRNIKVTGHRPYKELALWQKAADVLVLPNSGKEDISRFYTSPMKLFSYMASGRPIIASDLPSIREVVSKEAVLFVPADDSSALAKEIGVLLEDPLLQKKLSEKALEEVKIHTWLARASRISSFIEGRLMIR